MTSPIPWNWYLFHTFFSVPLEAALLTGWMILIAYIRKRKSTGWSWLAIAAVIANLITAAIHILIIFNDLNYDISTAIWNFLEGFLQLPSWRLQNLSWLIFYLIYFIGCIALEFLIIILLVKWMESPKDKILPKEDIKFLLLGIFLVNFLSPPGYYFATLLGDFIYFLF